MKLKDKPDDWLLYKENQEFRRLIKNFLTLNITDSVSGKKTKTLIKLELDFFNSIKQVPYERSPRIIDGNDW